MSLISELGYRKVPHKWRNGRWTAFKAWALRPITTQELVRRAVWTIWLVAAVLLAIALLVMFFGG